MEKQLSGANHPEVALRLNNLALAYCATDRVGEAKQSFERALSILETHRNQNGNTHRHTDFISANYSYFLAQLKQTPGKSADNDE